MQVYWSSSRDGCEVLSCTITSFLRQRNKLPPQGHKLPLPSNSKSLNFSWLEISPSKSSPRRSFLIENKDCNVLVLGDLGLALLISFSYPEIRNSTMLGPGLVLESWSKANSLSFPFAF